MAKRRRPRGKRCAAAKRARAEAAGSAVSRTAAPHYEYAVGSAPHDETSSAASSRSCCARWRRWTTCSPRLCAGPAGTRAPTPHPAGRGAGSAGSATRPPKARHPCATGVCVLPASACSVASVRLPVMAWCSCGAQASRPQYGDHQQRRFHRFERLLFRTTSLGLRKRAGQCGISTKICVFSISENWSN
jgi:hypothetical protein